MSENCASHVHIHVAVLVTTTRAWGTVTSLAFVTLPSVSESYLATTLAPVFPFLTSFAVLPLQESLNFFPGDSLMYEEESSSWQLANITDKIPDPCNYR